MSFPRSTMKRFLDVVVAAFCLILTGPLMALVALGVLFTMGRPILFRQRRSGLKARPFTLLKFRSMTNACDEKGMLFPDAQRITPFGRWIRRWSLDELPQLWNVLRGDMSLVGPRPLFPEYDALYTPEQRRRAEVRPGLTGWAQINGRNALTWEEKLALDVWYVEHRSLFLDLWIVLRSIGLVLSGRGISAEGHCTVSRFTGSRASQANSSSGHDRQDAGAPRHAGKNPV